MSSTTRAPIITTGISTYVDVYDYVENRLEPSRRSKRMAGYYLAQGFRVTDQHSFDLMVEHHTDGSRHLVRGEDVYVTHLDKNRRKTILGSSSRPANPPPRELTDYEKCVVHIIDECETPNCDHPVHFVGSTTGDLEFGASEKRTDDGGKKGGEGGAGRSAAPGA
ncbi:hypothetical protein B0A55_07675 [Friedmanniomyces simplex]|uniref:Uncharacterized protein n=1 Tax=Friedmanniomyces simplex TaxID=329884 RepID=A0A4V6WL15_9PEZI|nr:hypothetical protein B0A55_07675 [Friedmanniomyces simplex]